MNLSLFKMAIAVSFLASCASENRLNLKDNYQYLVEIKNPQVDTWVENQNRKTIENFAKDDSFKESYAEILKKENSEENLPTGIIRGAYFYNTLKNDKHKNGIWRRILLADLLKKQEKWETLVDLDSLSAKEHKNLLLSDSACFAPLFEKCLLFLSLEGADQVVVKEFNLKQKIFVTGPTSFTVDKAFKTQAKWINENEILLMTDFGKDSISAGGYGLDARIWSRGQSIDQLKSAFKANAKSTGVFFYDEEIESLKEPLILADYFDFRDKDYWVRTRNAFDFKLNLPSDADLLGVVGDSFIVKLKKSWDIAHHHFKQDAIIAVSMNLMRTGQLQAEEIYAPGPNEFVGEVRVSKNFVWVQLLKDVTSRLISIKKDKGEWRSENYPIANNGTISLKSVSSDSDNFILYFSNFLTPKQMYFVSGNKEKPQLIRTRPIAFDTKDLVSEIKWTQSKDGTRIPYFLIHKKNMVFNSENPTLIYGYGAADEVNSPWYLGHVGKAWAEKGGVFVNAVLRGGGEFGADWRAAGMKENKQNTFNDLLAISEDLFHLKITSPQKLGIYGSSWGGLLVSAVFTQKPELFGAVAAIVPMEDMINYPLLSAGEMWTGEFGDPRDPKYFEILEKYSPYQNVLKEKTYPNVLFVAARNDDRMHPAHARRMAAKMEDQGHLVYYFENMDGGHAMSSHESFSYQWAMTFRFFQKILGLE